MSIKLAKSLDREDTLAAYREEFYIQTDTIYLDGNSLGLLSKRAERKVYEILDAWKTFAIDGWLHGEYPWFFLSERLGEMSAPLVGANSEEVVVTASTTVNLHQLIASFYHPSGTRTKIVADELNFPTDIYALQSQLRLQGYDPNEHLVRVKSKDGRFLEEEDIIAAMTDEVALVVLPTVLYKSGQLLDIDRLTNEAHYRGILIGFDGCHSVGVIPHEFSAWDVDFAYWCNYKYVNGGPGSVGSLYVNKKHFGTMPGLAGWFGSNKMKQFDMSHTFTSAETAGAFQIATPHILSAAPLLGSLSMFSEVPLEQIRQKSLHITRYLMGLVETKLTSFGFHIGTPKEDARRGGHVSIEHEKAACICKALKAHGVVPDFRAPNIIRLAPVAFYTSYEDVWKAVEILKNIMKNKIYEQYENTREIIG